ncbi:MAG TPA: type VI secretion system Vgr family protein [Burkholderiaceae bacterium]|nr:type VI secretion system Vgr family protein [Burkholderiaceae bacterium]
MTDLRSALQAIEALLDQHARLIELQCAVPNGASLMVERFRGHEAVNAAYRFDIDVLSTSAHVPLRELLGEPITLRVLLADGGKRSWHGVVTQASALGADGGLARYRLMMEPAAAALALRHDTRIFQDKTATDIAAELLKLTPLTELRVEVSRTLPALSLVTQFRETDAAFLARVLAMHGLNHRYEHRDDANEGQHLLVISDPETPWPAAREDTIRFHRAAATEASDTITRFVVAQRVRPTQVTLSSWDYKRAAGIGGEDTAATDPTGLALEHYDGGGVYRERDSAHAAQRAFDRLAEQRLDAQGYEGEGSVRTLAAGTAFTLVGHSTLNEQRFVVLSVEHEAANNLGAGIAALLGSTDVEAGTYRNRFDAVAHGTPVVPAAAPPKPLAAGVQTAVVVGLEGEAVTTERDHRVKVVFPWDRRGLRDASAGTWVRVAEWFAGPNWGSVFTPRVGSEVLVDFLDADIDRPVIVGALYNGQDHPPWVAGADVHTDHAAALSGLHTLTLDGAGHNQWLSDDSAGALATRLETSQAESRLTLGAVTAHTDAASARGALLGRGFSWTTQGWSSARGGEGVFVTTRGRANANGTQLNASEAIASLRHAETRATTWHTTAEQHHVSWNAVQSPTPLRAAIDPTLNGRFDAPVGNQTAATPDGDAVERFAQPMVLIDSAADQLWTTRASMVLFAGGSLSTTVANDTHLAAGRTIAVAAGGGAHVLAARGGVDAIAAQGPVVLRAHGDSLEFLAHQDIRMTSTTDSIEVLAAGPIVLKAGRSEVRLEGGNITFACPGQFTVKSAQNNFPGGASGAATINALPKGDIKLFDEQVRAVDPNTGEPIAGLPFIAKVGDETLEGRTDENGLIPRIATANAEAVEIYWQPKSNHREGYFPNDVHDEEAC